MLTHLQIRDFAIIDAIELELRPGLTVLTGETGAGNPFWWTRYNCSPGTCGSRSRSTRIRTRRNFRHLRSRAGATRTEAMAGGTVTGWERRPRHPPRRLRGWALTCYLNGQTVPLQLLREAGNILIDIHGQHEFQSLMRTVRAARAARRLRKTRVSGRPGRYRTPGVGGDSQQDPGPRIPRPRPRGETRAVAIPGAGVECPAVERRRSP